MLRVYSQFKTETVRLTDEKVKKVASLCNSLLHNKAYTIGEVTTVIHILVSNFPDVMYGLLH